MNSVKIKRGKSINVDIQCIFSQYEYIHARCIHMRKNSVFNIWYT